ncbi:MAG: hypothetical protein JRH20_14515 [Deltaproteobacteria bacterium]|nr:hypothetical protein [Deltaproteobacteria bacterium]
MNLDDERIFDVLLQGVEKSPRDSGVNLWQYGDERAIPILRAKIEELSDSEDAEELKSVLTTIRIPHCG